MSSVFKKIKTVIAVVKRVVKTPVTNLFCRYFPPANKTARSGSRMRDIQKASYNRDHLIIFPASRKLSTFQPSATL
jgi:hypothetical protein